MSIPCQRKKILRTHLFHLTQLLMYRVCVCLKQKEAIKMCEVVKAKFFNISACIEINSASGISSSSSCYFRIHKNIEKKIFSTKLVDIKTPSNERKCVSHNAMDDDEPLQIFLLSPDRFIDDDDDLSLASCSIPKMNFCDSLNDDVEWHKKNK